MQGIESQGTTKARISSSGAEPTLDLVPQSCLPKGWVLRTSVDLNETLKIAQAKNL